VKACPMNLVNALGMARHMWTFSRIHALLGIRMSMHFIFESPNIMYRKYGIPWAHGCAGAVIANLASLVPKLRVNLTRFTVFLSECRTIQTVSTG
jgi:hypothetical protein